MQYTLKCDNVRDISALEGKVLTEIQTLPTDSPMTEELVFICDDGTHYRMGFERDGHPNTYLEDIAGDLADLVGSPVLCAAEDTNQDAPRPEGETDERYNWCFYNLATAKGHVTLRWYASNEANYSACVDFLEMIV